MKAVFWGQVGGRGVYTPLDRVQSCNSLGLVHPSQFDEFPPSLPLPNSGNGLLRPPLVGSTPFLFTRPSAEGVISNVSEPQEVNKAQPRGRTPGPEESDGSPRAPDGFGLDRGGPCRFA